MKTTFLIFALTILYTSLFAQPNVLKDINPGSGGSLSYVDNGVTRVGVLVYFAATTPSFGDELWKTDGTEAGTQMVKDINPGATGSRLNNFYALDDNVLLFTADDGVSGLELWRSDGTEAGTFIVKDIFPGSADAIYDFINNPIYYSLFGGKLYFGADNGVSGRELWSSDGTEAGTTMVKDIYAGGGASFPVSFGLHNGLLFFSARTSSQGDELWKTDGTTAGTSMVKDIYPGFFGSSPANLLSLGSTLIFTADDNVHDVELWKTDGTAAGTVLVKDIKTNSAGTFSTSGFETQPNSFENRFALVGDIAFFSAIDDSTGIELWKTDGTAAGTVRVKDASAAQGSDGYAPQNFAQLGNEIYYKYDNDINGIELWKSDGTAAGTKMVKDIVPGSSGSFYLPTYIYAHQGKLYFGAQNGNNGIELMESDGTSNGTKLLANIYPGSGDSYPNRFISLGKKLIFWANKSFDDAEPWVYIAPISVTTIVTPVMCYGDSTGSITVLSPKATAPFTAVWEPNWVSGLQPGNLPAGTYHVTVTDAEGGTGSATITISQPTALMGSLSTTPETGTMGNGTATVNFTGGILPYTYLWNTTPAQTTKTATNLHAGMYSCTITDAHGCTATAAGTVSQLSGTIEKPGERVQMDFQPNPANSMAYWSVAGETVVSGRVIRADGQVLRSLSADELSQGQLDTGLLSNGAYYLVMTMKTGRSAYTQFVVAR